MEQNTFKPLSSWLSYEKSVEYSPKFGRNANLRIR